MKRLSCLLHRLAYLRPTAFATALALAIVLSGDAIGQNHPSIGTSGSVLGDDVLYTIGGSSAVAMGPSANLTSDLTDP